MDQADPPRSLDLHLLLPRHRFPDLAHHKQIRQYYLWCAQRQPGEALVDVVGTQLP